VNNSVEASAQTGLSRMGEYREMWRNPGKTGGKRRELSTFITRFEQKVRFIPSGFSSKPK